MYDAHNVKPAFAFGHGLSYTTFEYSGLSFDPRTLTATFTINNTGIVYGAEIAQLYLGFPADAGEPPKVLRGFRKVLCVMFHRKFRAARADLAQVNLSPGESRIVAISMRDRDLSVWDASKSDWSRWHGKFSLYEFVYFFGLFVLTRFVQFHRLLVARYQTHTVLRLLMRARAFYTALISRRAVNISEKRC
jgi:hypothetical protein